MSDEVFNDVTYFNYPYDGRLVPITTPQVNPNKTVRNVVVHNPHDWMVFTINTGQMAQARLEAVMDFVRARLGNADDFLFLDEHGSGDRGYIINRQVIATGDGIETQFQVKQTIGGRDFERWDIVPGSESVWIDGTPAAKPTNYSIDYTKSGIITTVLPVPNTKDIETACQYYRRVRFAGEYAAIMQAFELTNMQLVLVEEGVK